MGFFGSESQSSTDVPLSNKEEKELIQIATQGINYLVKHGEVFFNPKEEQKRVNFPHTRNDVRALAAIQHFYLQAYGIGVDGTLNEEERKRLESEILKPGHLLYQCYKKDPKVTGQVRRATSSDVTFSDEKIAEEIQNIPSELQRVASKMLESINAYMNSAELGGRLEHDHSIKLYFSFLKQEVIRIFTSNNGGDFSLIRSELKKLSKFMELVRTHRALIVKGAYTLPGYEAPLHGATSESELEVKNEGLQTVKTKSTTHGTIETEAGLITKLEQAGIIVDSYISKAGIGTYLDALRNTLSATSNLKGSQLFAVLYHLGHPGKSFPYFERIYGGFDPQNSSDAQYTKGAHELYKSDFKNVVPPLNGGERAIIQHFDTNAPTKKPKEVSGASSSALVVASPPKPARDDLVKFIATYLPLPENASLEQKGKYQEGLVTFSEQLFGFFAVHVRIVSSERLSQAFSYINGVVGTAQTYAYLTPYLKVFFKAGISLLETQLNNIRSLKLAAEQVPRLAKFNLESEQAKIFNNSIITVLEAHETFYKKLLTSYNNAFDNLLKMNESTLLKLLSEVDKAAFELTRAIQPTVIADIKKLHGMGYVVKEGLEAEANALEHFQLPRNVFTTQLLSDQAPMQLLNPRQEASASASSSTLAIKDHDPDDDVDDKLTVTVVEPEDDENLKFLESLSASKMKSSVSTSTSSKKPVSNNNNDDDNDNSQFVDPLRSEEKETPEVDVDGLRSEIDRLKAELSAEKNKNNAYKKYDAETKQWKLLAKFEIVDEYAQLNSQLLEQVAQLQKTQTKKDAEHATFSSKKDQQYLTQLKAKEDQHAAQLKEKDEQHAAQLKEKDLLLSKKDDEIAELRLQALGAAEYRKKFQSLNQENKSLKDEGNAKRIDEAKKIIEGLPAYLQKDFEDIANRPTISQVLLEKIHFVQRVTKNIEHILKQMTAYTSIYLSENAKPNFGPDLHEAGRAEIKDLQTMWTSPENQHRYVGIFMALISDNLIDDKQDLKEIQESYVQILNEILRELGGHIVNTGETRRKYLSHYHHELLDEIKNHQTRQITDVSFRGGPTKESLNKVKNSEVKSYVAVAVQFGKAITEPLAGKGQKIDYSNQWELVDDEQPAPASSMISSVLVPADTKPTSTSSTAPVAVTSSTTSLSSSNPPNIKPTSAPVAATSSTKTLSSSNPPSAATSSTSTSSTSSTSSKAPSPETSYSYVNEQWFFGDRTKKQTDKTEETTSSKKPGTKPSSNDDDD